MSMSNEDFLTSLRAIETECTNKKAALRRIYVQENAQAQVGSIVTDGTNIINVDQVTWSSLNNNMRIVYVGIKLKKNLVAYKHGEPMSVHESNPNFRIIKK